MEVFLLCALELVCILGRNINAQLLDMNEHILKQMASTKCKVAMRQKRRRRQDANQTMFKI